MEFQRWLLLDNFGDEKKPVLSRRGTCHEHLTLILMDNHIRTQGLIQVKGMGHDRDIRRLDRAQLFHQPHDALQLIGHCG